MFGVIGMTYFKRIFKYILPQWPRVIATFLGAVIVAILLSVSFMTVIPLMKVMLGQEGLHGWVDRKSSEYQYGLKIYVPNATDIITGEGSENIAYRLVVSGIKEAGIAEAAGLKTEDRIVGVGDFLTSEDNKKVSFSKMLQELATTQRDKIPVQIKRLGRENQLKLETVSMNTIKNKDYIESLDWGRVRRVTWSLKLWLVKNAQWAVSFLPREQTKANRTNAVIFIIIGISLITVIRCLAKFFQAYIAYEVVQVATNHLREDAVAHLMNVPMRTFANERPTDSVSRIVRDTSVVGAAIKVLLGKALREPLNAFFMLLCAMLLNWQLTLIFLCAAPMILGLLYVFGRKMKKATRKSLMAASEMLSKLQEVMTGLKVVKVYNQQQYETKSFKNINNRLLKQQLKIAEVNAATMPVLEVLGMFGGALALVVGVQWVTRSQMEGSEFFGLLILLGAAAEAIRKTSSIWNKIQEAEAAAERVFAVIDTPVEAESSKAYELTTVKNKIEFANITFTYPGSATPVLKDFNLSVQAGCNVAIVGPNGSGKTTLANLLPRFYDPDSGQILIDAKDIRQATIRSLRSQIAMVTQNIVTFNDTIAANIAYGRFGASAEDIIEAAKRSYAHEFIAALPQGYETIIGEQGAGLSGGQLQRIVIARAIIKNPKILIFDEATSQVDADSEAKIHKALENIMKGRTTFVIAHRFSTVISADIIVVLDDGQVIARGRHEELIKTCPLYQNLYQTQLIEA